MGLFLNKSYRYRQKLDNMTEDYNNTVSIFDNEVLTLLNRLYNASKVNEEYVLIYRNYKDQYDCIKNGLNKDCQLALDSFLELINDNSFSGIKDIYESNLLTLQSFNKSVNNLRKRLNTLFERENVIRNEIIPYKEKYRFIKGFIRKNAENLKGLEKPIDLVCDGIDKIFEDFEKCLDILQFKQAMKLEEELKSLILSYEKIIKELPSLNYEVSFAIKDNIELLRKQMHEFEKNDYPLDVQALENHFESIYQTLDVLKNKLLNLDIKHVKEDIDDINLFLSNITRVFDAEIVSKTEFLSKSAHLDQSFKEIRNQFYKFLNLIPIYSKYYLIDKSFNDKLMETKKSVDTMFSMRNLLDFCLNCKKKYTYSALNRIYDNFDKNYQIAKKSVEEITTFLLTLKSRAEGLYLSINDFYLKLLQFRSLIKDLNSDFFDSNYLDKIYSLEQQIKLVYNISYLPPIDLTKAENYFKDISQELENLISECNKTVQEMSKAENAFVYCNLIRREFVSFRSNLIKAEILFNDGDFTHSYENTIVCLKKVFPEREDTI